jgi:hypothetical protein
VVGYQHFRGPCCIHFLVENGSKVLWNPGILAQHYAASQHRKTKPKKNHNRFKLHKSEDSYTVKWVLVCPQHGNKNQPE